MSLNLSERRAEYEESLGDDAGRSSVSAEEGSAPQENGLDRELDRLDGHAQDEEEDGRDVLLEEGAHILANRIRLSDDMVLRSASTEPGSGKAAN